MSNESDAAHPKSLREPLALSVTQAARCLSVGRTFLYSLIRSKKIRAVRSGRRTLIPLEELKSFVATLPEVNLGTDTDFSRRRWAQVTAPRGGHNQWGSQERLFQIRAELRRAYRRQHHRHCESDTLREGGDLLALSPEERGQLIGLTFDVWKGFEPHLKTVRPCDTPRTVVQAYMALRRRDQARTRQRKRRQRIRDAIEGVGDLSVRGEAIWMLLHDLGPLTVPQLTKSLARSEAFNSGRKSSSECETIRRLVNREVDRLLQKRIVDVEYVPAARRHTRLVSAKALYAERGDITKRDSGTAGQMLSRLRQQSDETTISAV